MFIAVLLLAGCFGSDDEPARTREGFCQDWAVAACNDEVVSVCQAADAESCRQSQEDFCRSIVPKSFSDAQGDECIHAIAAAYKDGNLDAEELLTVRSLGEPCDRLVQGPKSEGESCEEDDDCDRSAGLDCIRKSDAESGSCEAPELVQPGDDCGADQQVCTPGYYCNGENCISANDIGEACESQDQCDEDAFCNDDGECEARFAVDKPCTDDHQCAAGICYDFDGEKVCTNRIVLSRSEPICADLR